MPRRPLVAGSTVPRMRAVKQVSPRLACPRLEWAPPPTPMHFDIRCAKDYFVEIMVSNPGLPEASGIRSEQENMGKDVTFEAQIRRDGEWQTIGVFDDRETAMSEAERILEARRTSAARVLQVIFDTDLNQCNEYTVFRASCFDEGTARPRPRLGGVDMFRPHRQQRPAARPASSFPWATIAAVIVLCLSGLAATMLLR